MRFWQSQHWQVFALGSAFFAGLTAILGKVGVKEVDSNLATFVRTIVILFIAFGFAAAFGPPQQGGLIGQIRSIPGWSLLFLVLSGVATGLSWLCYYHALKLGPASKVAPIDKLSVVFAIVLAIVFLHEKLTWQVALGGSFVTAGAIVLALA